MSDFLKFAIGFAIVVLIALVACTGLVWLFGGYPSSATPQRSARFVASIDSCSPWGSACLVVVTDVGTGREHVVAAPYFESTLLEKQSKVAR